MTKKQDAVPIQHQTALRLILAERAIAQTRYKADLEARQQVIREYLIQILDEAGLDPHVFGIDPTLTKFVTLELPKSEIVPAENAAKSIAEVKERSGNVNMKVPSSE